MCVCVCACPASAREPSVFCPEPSLPLSLYTTRKVKEVHSAPPSSTLHVPSTTTFTTCCLKRTAQKSCIKAGSNILFLFLFPLFILLLFPIITTPKYTPVNNTLAPGSGKQRVSVWGADTMGEGLERYSLLSFIFSSYL